jgi:hypothetical protein
LFQSFAQTDPTEQGILTFATSYGGLGDSAWVDVYPAVPRDELIAAGVPFVERGGRLCCRAEPLAEWRHQIFQMRCVVELWELARQDDRRGLAQHIEWRLRDDGVYEARYRSAAALTDDEEADRLGVSPVIDAFAAHTPQQPHRPGDVLSPALGQIRRLLNANLARAVVPEVRWRDTSPALELTFAPHGLLGVLWLQFAQAVEHVKEFRVCRGCGQTFEVWRSAARSDKVFCSHVCRSRAHRERQERARQLFAEGKSVEEIARALDAKPSAVKGWLKIARQEE